MKLTRIVIRNFRSFSHLDVSLLANTVCVVGENNTGKSNLLHAIRLCLDVNLSSTYRSLIPNDIHSPIDTSHPSQVLIGLEISDFKGKTNEEALVGAWQSKPGLARLIYRFRPKLGVREDLETGEITPGALTLKDYQWEITGGGDPARDLADIGWDEDVGSSIRFADLQSFLVVYLQPLRDVESDLRQIRTSPLARLIEASDIENVERDALVQILRDSNAEIKRSPTVDQIAKAVDVSFKKVAGPAFSMDVGLGLAEPSFQAIVRALRILLTNAAIENFDPSSNGLGLNNILYISILIEYFHKRLAQQNSAGQIILFEEPEAHLHPQLQLSLFNALTALPVQSLLTTHSTHITAQAGLSSYVVLTQTGEPATASAVPAKNPALTPDVIRDLERYLDATKSNLIFARNVMLVEGPAELFLIPALVKNVKGIDLDREGISVIPIYGVHFDVYAKLFSRSGLPKKCAIVADGDLKPSDATAESSDEDELPAPPDLKTLNSHFVRVFTCETTFERAITRSSTLPMLQAAAMEIGAPIVAAKMQAAAEELAYPGTEQDRRKQILVSARASILSTARRFGKARFAQIVARHADKAGDLPKYIDKAVDWLLKP